MILRSLVYSPASSPSVFSTVRSSLLFRLVTLAVGLVLRSLFALLNVQLVVSVEVLLRFVAFHGVHEPAGEGRLVEQRIVRTEKIVTVPNSTVMIDLAGVLDRGIVAVVAAAAVEVDLFWYIYEEWIVGQVGASQFVSVGERVFRKKFWKKIFFFHLVITFQKKIS